MEVKYSVEILAAEIVARAIEDWRMLIEKGIVETNGGLGRDLNYISLRRFFKSWWCDLLLEPTGMNGFDILAILEKELKEAQQKALEEMKKRKDT